MKKHEVQLIKILLQKIGDFNYVVKEICEYYLSNISKNCINVIFYSRKKSNLFLPLYKKNELNDFKVDFSQLNKIKNISINKKIIYIPLIYRHKIMAIITLIFKSKVKRNIDLRKIYEITDFFSAIYYNANMYNFAIRDSLTGIYNKRFFLYKANEILNHYSLIKGNFALIMFDIDKFKHYNDKYGHLVGDYILKNLSQKVNNFIGEKGILARYGGEEFIIIMPEIDIKGGKDIAESIRNRVSKIRMSNKDFFWKITISLGVSNYPENGNTIDELILSADKALYYSKENGRDRVTHYNDLKN